MPVFAAAVDRVRCLYPRATITALAQSSVIPEVLATGVDDVLEYEGPAFSHGAVPPTLQAAVRARRIDLAAVPYMNADGRLYENVHRTVRALGCDRMLVLPVDQPERLYELSDQEQLLFGEPLRDQARYAFHIGLQYARWIAAAFGRPATGVPDLTGLSVLELGPGPNLGGILTCRALGASIAVLDKYPAAWDGLYHPLIYRTIDAVACEELPDPRWRMFGAMADDAGTAFRRLRICDSDLASPPSRFPQGAFDAIVSNAVLEHVWDIEAMAGELARITRLGGIGIHQVDFRDHRNMAAPLEFLTLPDPEYKAMFDDANNGNGNRFRLHELQRTASAAGWVVEQVEVNMRTEAGEIDRVRPRLASRFASMTDEHLDPLSARLFLRRPRTMA
jgi:SAM-dependent methyltransferase